MNFSGKMAKILVLCICLSAGIGAAVILQAADRADREVTTDLLDEQVNCVGEELAKIVSPQEIRRPQPVEKRARIPSKEGEEWVLRSSLSAGVDIPAGESYVLCFDH